MQGGAARPATAAAGVRLLHRPLQRGQRRIIITGEVCSAAAPGAACSRLLLHAAVKHVNQPTTTPFGCRRRG